MSPKFTKALITGSTGFVGSHFLSRLIARYPYFDVSLGCRASSAIDKKNGWRVQAVHLDLLGDIEIELSPDIVFHIAGEKRDLERMWNVNFEGTQKLLDWSARQGVKRFVYLSSVGVYGASKNSGVVSESSVKRPKNAYEDSKNSAEELVKEYCLRYGLEFVILQPSNVIGWADGKGFPLLGMMKMIKRGWFTYFDDASACFNYVAVEDVAAALVSAASSQISNSVFILNSPIPIKKAVDWIAEELSVEYPSRYLPTRLGLMASILADKLSGFTQRSLPFGRERFDELTNTTCYEGSAICAATGFDYPTGIEAAIRSLTRQYLKDGLL